MAVTNFSPLLGLALPTTGDLSGTWGTTVNDSITSLIDSAVAGTTTLSVDADVTLSTTNGSANQARNAVILWTASNGATTRNITAPAQSKAYVVINAGTGSIVVRGSGPTTGVTLVTGEKAIVAWNGSDFVKVATSVITNFTGVLNVPNGGTGVSTLTGVVKGNGTSTFSAATAGTDYVAPGGALGTPSSGTLSSCTVDGTNAVGFRSLPPVGTKTGSYTLATTDVGKYVQVGSGGSITIPDATFSEGNAISIFNNTSGAITITCSITTAYIAGVDLDKASVTLATRGVATILFISSTVCVISGNVT